MSEPERTIGSLAQLACTWEVLARKAGNVCPGREFPDLTVNDFLLSAAAIAPVLDQAPHQPLGVTILRCIEETRKVVKTNTNLGIVLLLAPLASVPLDETLEPGLKRVLERTTVEDSRNVYAAIRLAKPGGLGEVKEQDVCDEPTLPLRDVMALAMDRDMIAAQYATAFDAVFEFRGKVVRGIEKYVNVERAVIDTQLDALSCHVDSHVSRKLGEAHAAKLKIWARNVIDAGGPVSWRGRPRYRAFDAWLRTYACNPGTTADLITAALLVALRENSIPLTTPFAWKEHPFETT